MADSTPLIPRPLVEWLERVYPNDVTKLADLSGDDLIQREIGRQQIIQVLRNAYNRQQGDTA